MTHNYLVYRCIYIGRIRFQNLNKKLNIQLLLSEPLKDPAISFAGVYITVKIHHTNCRVCFHLLPGSVPRIPVLIRRIFVWNASGTTEDAGDDEGLLQEFTVVGCWSGKRIRYPSSRNSPLGIKRLDGIQDSSRW